MTEYRNKTEGIYRARDGVVLGVCKGLADYFDFPVFWVRMALVVMFIFSGFWPVIGVYLVAAFFMRPEPVKPIAERRGTGILPQLRQFAEKRRGTPEKEIPRTRPPDPPDGRRGHRPGIRMETAFRRLAKRSAVSASCADS